jgi:hypothetical protein
VRVTHCQPFQDLLPRPSHRPPFDVQHSVAGVVVVTHVGKGCQGTLSCVTFCRRPWVAPRSPSLACALTRRSMTCWLEARGVSWRCLTCPPWPPKVPITMITSSASQCMLCALYIFIPVVHNQRASACIYVFMLCAISAHATWYARPSRSVEASLAAEVTALIVFYFAGAAAKIPAHRSAVVALEWHPANPSICCSGSTDTSVKARPTVCCMQ